MMDCLDDSGFESLEDRSDDITENAEKISEPISEDANSRHIDIFKSLRSKKLMLSASSRLVGQQLKEVCRKENEGFSLLKSGPKDMWSDRNLQVIKRQRNSSLASGNLQPCSSKSKQPGWKELNVIGGYKNAEPTLSDVLPIRETGNLKRKTAFPSDSRGFKDKGSNDRGSHVLGITALPSAKFSTLDRHANYHTSTREVTPSEAAHGKDILGAAKRDISADEDLAFEKHVTWPCAGENALRKLKGFYNCPNSAISGALPNMAQSMDRLRAATEQETSIYTVTTPVGSNSQAEDTQSFSEELSTELPAFDSHPSVIQESCSIAIKKTPSASRKYTSMPRAEPTRFGINLQRKGRLLSTSMNPIGPNVYEKLFADSRYEADETLQSRELYCGESDLEVHKVHTTLNVGPSERLSFPLTGKSSSEATKKPSMGHLFVKGLRDRIKLPGQSKRSLEFYEKKSAISKQGTLDCDSEQLYDVSLPKNFDGLTESLERNAPYVVKDVVEDWVSPPHQMKTSTPPSRSLSEPSDATVAPKEGRHSKISLEHGVTDKFKKFGDRPQKISDIFANMRKNKCGPSHRILHKQRLEEDFDTKVLSPIIEAFSLRDEEVKEAGMQASSLSLENPAGTQEQLKVATEDLFNFLYNGTNSSGDKIPEEVNKLKLLLPYITDGKEREAPYSASHLEGRSSCGAENFAFNAVIEAKRDSSIPDSIEKKYLAHLAGNSVKRGRIARFFKDSTLRWIRKRLNLYEELHLFKSGWKSRYDEANIFSSLRITPEEHIPSIEGIIPDTSEVDPFSKGNNLFENIGEHNLTLPLLTEFLMHKNHALIRRELLIEYCQFNIFSDKAVLLNAMRLAWGRTHAFPASLYQVIDALDNGQDINTASDTMNSHSLPHGDIPASTSCSENNRSGITTSEISPLSSFKLAKPSCEGTFCSPKQVLLCLFYCENIVSPAEMGTIIQGRIIGASGSAEDKKILQSNFPSQKTLIVDEIWWNFIWNESSLWHKDWHAKGEVSKTNSTDQVKDECLLLLFFHGKMTKRLEETVLFPHLTLPMNLLSF